MTEHISTREIIDRLVNQSGIKKKLAAELLRVIPLIIEEGLIRDGEVRIKGLGTFRMKWTRERPGRNPKTGESVAIPPHNRLVFLPEQSLKDYINRDNRLLDYKIVEDKEEEEVGSWQLAVGSQQSAVSGQQSAVGGQQPKVMPEPELEADPEPELPYSVRKRRLHWVIPVALIVIAGLSVLFYFRNFHNSSQEANTVQSAKFKVQSAEPDKQSSLQTDTLVNIPPETQPETLAEAQPETPRAELITQGSQLPSNPRAGGQGSRLITITEGKHLFQLAREEYGNPFLWVLIYKANPDKISNPDQAIIGKEVKIPILEGTPDQLSHHDSLEVSEGYRLVYEYYKANNDSRAVDFKRGADRYKPND